MRKRKALEEFRKFDQMGRRVFLVGDIRTLFGTYSDKSTSRLIEQFVNSGILERACRGVFVFEQSTRPKTHLVQEVARALRRESHTYLSLESALSEYGAISQVPTGHFTFMTTGRRGEFETPYGVIEFTHTSQHPSEFLGDLTSDGRPLPRATLERALRDLRRVGRNTAMIQDEVVREIQQEDSCAELC